MTEQNHQDHPSDHVILRKNLVAVLALSLLLLVAMALLWYVDQRTGVLDSLASRW